MSEVDDKLERFSHRMKILHKDIAQNRPRTLIKQKEYSDKWVDLPLYFKKKYIISYMASCKIYIDHGGLSGMKFKNIKYDVKNRKILSLDYISKNN